MKVKWFHTLQNDRPVQHQIHHFENCLLVLFVIDYSGLIYHQIHQRYVHFLGILCRANHDCLNFHAREHYHDYAIFLKKKKIIYWLNILTKLSLIYYSFINKIDSSINKTEFILSSCRSLTIIRVIVGVVVCATVTGIIVLIPFTISYCGISSTS